MPLFGVPETPKIFGKKNKGGKMVPMDIFRIGKVPVRT